MWVRNPDYQPLKCCAERHLWHQGLALAIYQKAAAVTNGGEHPFTANQTTLAKFFDAHKNSVLNAMNFLRKKDWLRPTDEEDEYKWVSHTDWAKAHDKANCIERVLAPPTHRAVPQRQPVEVV
jgi:hypothetical protein